MGFPLPAALWLLFAQGPGVEIEDRIDLVQVDRRLLAVGANGSLLEVRLEVGERVLDTRSGGLVGVAATSSRLLGVTTRSSSFRELRYRVREREAAPHRIYLGDRVALVPFASRLAALAPGSTQWNELRLSPSEVVQRVLIESNLAAVVTHRRAIAFAAASGFVETTLSPNETVERISVEESSLVILTSRRMLVFRAGARRWVARLRDLS